MAAQSVLIGSRIYIYFYIYIYIYIIDLVHPTLASVQHTRTNGKYRRKDSCIGIHTPR